MFSFRHGRPRPQSQYPSVAFCGMILSNGLLKHHLITKSVNASVSPILLLSSGDIEQNPGPLEGSRGRYRNVHTCITMYLFYIPHIRITMQDLQNLLLSGFVLLLVYVQNVMAKSVIFGQ